MSAIENLELVLSEKDYEELNAEVDEYFASGIYEGRIMERRKIRQTAEEMAYTLIKDCRTLEDFQVVQKELATSAAQRMTYLHLKNQLF